MKVKIEFTETISKDQLLALGLELGNALETPATADQIKSFFVEQGSPEGRRILDGLTRTYYRAKADYYARIADGEESVPEQRAPWDDTGNDDDTNPLDR